MRLLFGLGVFPAACAAASTFYGMHRTTERSFCGSCHVMTVHQTDAEDPESNSLSARHARNPMFGGTNCYTCHADYGMLGYPMTKLGGMKHVYMYYLGGYGKMPIEEALKDIRVAKPYPNSNCMQCHSGGLASFKAVREHKALQEDLLTNRVACASAGCHGYSHPFNKNLPAEEHAQR
jgi:cytochrome c-type protein NapC